METPKKFCGKASKYWEITQKYWEILRKYLSAKK